MTPRPPQPAKPVVARPVPATVAVAKPVSVAPPPAASPRPTPQPPPPVGDWPTQIDYRDALQNPDTAFPDPALRGCKVEANKMGVPRGRAGAFATVYKLTRPDGTHLALKVFNFADGQRQGRYDAVSRHLNTLGSRKPDTLVGFNYQLPVLPDGRPGGIRVKRSCYPILTMDWVTGDSLGKWVETRMAARDAASVGHMAGHWKELVEGLAGADIAHGDLQHDNVMVCEARPKLVDYDGMWVPTLDGQAQLEYGKPAYQHPRRGEMPLHRGLDRFSAWVILLALRASAADPGLYHRFVVQTQNENLLFTESDLKDPKGSKLWPELLNNRDVEIRQWAGELRDCLDGPPDQVPPFSRDPAAPLRALCTAGPPRDWDAIVAEADRLARTRKPPPAEVARQVDEARQRVACRDRLLAGRGDPRKLAAAYVPALLADWPTQRGLAKQAAAAADTVRLLDELKRAAAAPGDGRGLVALWARHRPTLAGVAEADEYGRQADQWAARLAAAEGFVKLLAGSPTEQAVADAWAKVTAAGPHPILIPPAARTRGEQSAARAALLAKLKAVPAQPGEPADRALSDAWAGADPLLANCPEADPYRRRAAAAADRLAKVAAVEQALAGLAAGRTTAADVIRAAAGLPPDYPHRFRSQVAQTAQAAKRVTALTAALAAQPVSDTAVAAAWEELTTVHPADAGRLPPDTAARCRLAVARRDGVRKLDSALKGTTDTYTQDVRLWKTWRAVRGDVGKDCADAARLTARLMEAERRLKGWEALKAAMDRADLDKVRELAARPELAGYRPLEEVRGRLTELVALAGRLAHIRAALAGGGSDPLAPDDLQFLKAHHHQLDGACKNKLVALAARRLQTAADLTAGRPPFQADPSAAVPWVQVYWNWSGSGLVTRFVLAAHPGAALDHPDRAPPEVLATCRPEDHRRDGGGRRLVLPAGGPVFVSVWPVTDLGWVPVYGRPLVIGPVPPAQRRPA